MKKIMLCALLITLFAVLTVTAHAEYCQENEYGHKYYANVEMNCAHPHSGFLECACGSRYTIEKIYKYDCELCRKELCESGIHYYLYRLEDDVYEGIPCIYGYCMCGERIFMDVYEDPKPEFEPREDLFYTNGQLIVDCKYPHIAFGKDKKMEVLYDAECEGTCAACNFMSEYIQDAYDWSIVQLYVDDDFEDYSYYNQKLGYDYGYEYEEDYEEDLYDWLYDVRRFFE